METELIKRYFENRVSEEERKNVADWLANSENKEAVLAYIETAYFLETGSEEVQPFDLMFDKVEKAHPAKVISILKRKWIWAASAACVLFLLLGGVIGYYILNRSLNQGVVLFKTARTADGEYAQLTLSDGSEVYLGGNTKVSFAKRVDARQVVYLEGEAYFDLQDPQSSVVVKTKDLVTTAKGSKFNIKAFSKDSTVTVSVETGKVELRNSNETMPLLKLTFPKKDSSLKEIEPKRKVIPWVKIIPALTIKANEEATYDKTTKITGVSEMQPGTMPLMELRPAKVNNAGKQIIDTAGLSFDNAGINEIRNKIEQKYGVKMEVITNGNHLQLFTGEFQKNADLKEVLEQICDSLGLEYSVKDKNVKVTLLK